MVSRPPTRAGAVIGALLGLAAAPAFAATWPTSIVGQWNGVANQSPVTVVINAETATAGTCDLIAGTLTDNNSTIVNKVSGFYCPTSGRFNFRRKINGTNDTFQVYSGNLNLAAAGQLVRMSGSFNEYAQADALGTYAFVARQAPP
jgi:hypothetical protein